MKTRLVTICAAAATMAFAVDQSSCEFEMTAWKNVMPSKTSGNAVFSPAGFAITTAIMGEGLAGSARTTLMESFGLMADFGSLGRAHVASHAEANASNRVDVSVATSLWTTRRKALGADFVNAIQRDFEAEAGYLRDAVAVNAWTEAKTDGRIANVLPEVPKKVDTLVINAVAFEGAWDRPFNDGLTRKSSFTRSDGSKTSLPLMRKECEMLQINRSSFRVCQVNFAASGYHFILILPEKGATLAELREKHVTAKTMDGIKAILRSREGDGVSMGVAEFALPTFEVRSEWRLDSALRVAKVPRSGFGRIGNGSFVIDDVRQTVYFKVSEAGYSLTPGLLPDQPQKSLSGSRSELSSTSEDLDESSTRPKLGTPVICDRPFLFFVWDMKTDTFVIAGQFTGV